MNRLDAMLRPYGIGGQDAMAFLAALGAVAVVALIWMAFMERDPLPGRLKALAERREVLKKGLTRRTRRERTLARDGFVATVVARLRLARGKTANAAASRLAQAGWRSREALTAFLFAKAVLPLTIAALSVLLIYGVTLPFNDIQALLAAMVAIVLGAYTPEIFVKNAIQKRLKAIRKALPDAFDLMVICAEAGLSLDAALERVSREIGESCPELADEIGLTGLELGFLPERSKALSGLVDRVRLPGIKALISTLQQTERYGTPLAQSLRVLSAELRNERMMRAEEKAARLPAVMTVPMIAFILPPLFIVLIGPAILRTINSLSAM